MSEPTRFGPWAPGVDGAERVAQFRGLRCLVAAFCGSGHPVVTALREAELSEAAAERALEQFNEIPALRRRRLLSVFGAAQWPPRPARSRR
jgi:hypothetical protein